MPEVFHLEISIDSRQKNIRAHCTHHEAGGHAWCVRGVPVHGSCDGTGRAHSSSRLHSGLQDGDRCCELLEGATGHLRVPGFCAVLERDVN